MFQVTAPSDTIEQRVPVLQTHTHTRTDRECYKQDRLRRPIRRLTLHGIPLSPGPGGALVLVPVRLVHVGDLRNQRVIRVWVTQQGADGQQHLCNVTRQWQQMSSTPL